MGGYWFIVAAFVSGVYVCDTILVEHSLAPLAKGHGS